MRHSIRRQFALIFIGLMTGVIFSCWLMNTFFLEEYYITRKTKVLLDAYDTIKEVVNSDIYNTMEFPEEFVSKISDVCSVYNIMLYVVDANSRTKYAYTEDVVDLELRLGAYLFGVFDAEKVIRIQENFIVQQVQVGEDEFLEMYGKLSSGISFIMRTPVESIRESVKDANRFQIYVGIIATLVGGIIIWLVARKITKPILELNSISEKMVNLDFDAKYEGGARNEIGLLGENINKLSTSLERSISELKTANNELLNDIKKKERIDEMRKEFLANVSHELKTPIALIQGYAEGLAEGINDDPESRAYYCEVIMDEAAKMNSMVKKLLTLNQLESGNDTVTMERFDITTLVKNYIQSAEILTKQNEIEVCLEEYPSYYVWADEYKTEEVFMNYFSNAVNHCKGEKKIIVTLVQVEEERCRDGMDLEEKEYYGNKLSVGENENWGKELEAAEERKVCEDVDFAERRGDQEYVNNGKEVSAVREAEGVKSEHCKRERQKDRTKSRVRVGVFNTGDPIPEDAISHLWEKFYKVDKARTREYGGSGVGLSIVKAIMESMNQAYGVENYSNGVLFWFELESV
ncbi:MAG: HAMP domain-containing protein [Lachnospiraceae bacterium]|nr:HAMP domain-containing protein [Lachnospiraceae bacterium]